MGKCKASMDKVENSNSSDCFCLGSWLVYIFGTVAMFSSVMNLSDALWEMRKPSLLFTKAECDTGIKHAKCSLFFFLFVFVLMVCHVGTFSVNLLPFIKNYPFLIIFLLTVLGYLSENVRYTLYGYVYDRPYFETPLTWWFVLGCCVIFVFVCPVQISILNHARAYKTCETQLELLNNKIVPQSNVTECSLTIQVENRLSTPSKKQTSEDGARNIKNVDSFQKPLPKCPPPSPASTSSLANLPVSFIESSRGEKMKMQPQPMNVEIKQQMEESLKRKVLMRLEGVKQVASEVLKAKSIRPKEEEVDQQDEGKPKQNENTLENQRVQKALKRTKLVPLNETSQVEEDSKMNKVAPATESKRVEEVENSIKPMSLKEEGMQMAEVSKTKAMKPVEGSKRVEEVQKSNKISTVENKPTEGNLKPTLKTSIENSSQVEENPKPKIYVLSEESKRSKEILKSIKSISLDEIKLVKESLKPLFPAESALSDDMKRKLSLSFADVNQSKCFKAKEEPIYCESQEKAAKKSFAEASSPVKTLHLLKEFKVSPK